MSEARMPYSAPEATPIRWSIQEHQDGRSIVLAPGERLELVNDSARERRVIVPEAGIEPEAEAEVERLRADHRKAKRAAGRAIAERRLAEALVPGGILADQAERLDGLKSKLVDKIKAEVDGLRAERDAILRWAVSYSGYYEDEVRRLAGPDATTTEETNPDGR